MTIDTGWDYFNAIRSANSFLENFDIEVLKEFEFNDDYDVIMDKAKIFPYEIRFLRAFYFFELAKRYREYSDVDPDLRSRRDKSGETLFF